MPSIPSTPGMLLVWMDVEPAHTQDFNRWYDREHVEERIRIPGFTCGTRYQNVAGSPAYLGLYRTTSLDVFESDAYQQAFAHQTAWSVANLGRMLNAMRRVCTIEMEAGVGTGGWLALVRLGTSPVAADPASARDLGATLVALDGVIAARLLVPHTLLSTPLPAESRHGRVLDPILVIDATSHEAAIAAGRAAADATETAPEALSILQMMWQLRDTDLRG